MICLKVIKIKGIPSSVVGGVSQQIDSLKLNPISYSGTRLIICTQMTLSTYICEYSQK